MSSRETTTARQLGWPRPGELEYRDGRWCMPVDYGQGEIVRVTDPAWARQAATAYTIAANTLEAKLGIDMLPTPEREGERPAAPEQTGLMPAIPTPTARTCSGCATPLGEATPEELIAVAAGAPAGRCARCRPEAGDRRVAP